jgi:hypothetical protein
MPVGATFGNQISLQSVALAGDLVPGSELGVTFYWGALERPAGNYTVFVHLIDEQDNMVASHDGRPMRGWYSTLAWQPGHTIPDEHLIPLPAELPSAAYRLRVGLYLPETGDRLPVLDAAGQELPGNFVILPIE